VRQTVDQAIGFELKSGRWRSNPGKSSESSTYWYTLNKDCEYLQYGALSARIGGTAEVVRMHRITIEIGAHRHQLSMEPLLFDA